MKPIFADTFYFLALLNEEDEHHHRVVATASQIDRKLVTSDWVLAEVADALAGLDTRDLVAPFIQELSADPMVKIVPATRKLFIEGLHLYDQRTDKSWSLTDCISFVIMSGSQLSDVLTGDRHFQQAGFRALLL